MEPSAPKIHNAIVGSASITVAAQVKPVQAHLLVIIQGVMEFIAILIFNANLLHAKIINVLT